ncbi:MAG: efflux RND transporter permease subunit [Pseudomonadales bacterium]|nr:efflux RND transporter permease subunit [Pseudomonadales bacterium]
MDTENSDDPKESRFDGNLSLWAIQNPLLSSYVIGLMILLGVVSFFNLGQRDMPFRTERVMVISVMWPGASAEQMELQVADKIEKKLQETPWLHALRSFSKPGETYLFITLRDAIPDPVNEVPETWYQVRKKVADMRAELPPAIQGPFFNDEFGDVFPLVYALSSEGLSMAALKDQADLVRQELLNVPSVEKVNLLGQQSEQISVEFSLTKLKQLGIPPFAVLEQIKQNNSVLPGGMLDTSDTRFYLRPADGFQSVDEIRQLLIPVAEGQSVQLQDIADVRRTYVDPARMIMRFNGKQVIGFAISMRKGENVLDLGESVSKKIVEIKQQLPVGVQLELVANQPKVVSETLDTFLLKLLMAIGIVLLVSYFSLGFRAGLVVATAFPMVLGTTFLGMLYFGMDLERISLGALIISLGLLVDDAIIIIEMMQIKMEQGLDRLNAAGEAFRSTSFPMLTGTLISIFGFLPMAIAVSMMNEFFYGFYGVLTIALVTSWLVSVFFTPFIGYHYLPDPVGDKHNGNGVYQTTFYRGLRASVSWAVTHRLIILILFALLIAATVFAGKNVAKQFFPITDRPELIIEMWLPEGSPMVRTQEVAEKLDKILAQEKQVTNHVSYLGWDTPKIFIELNIEQPADNLIKTIVLTENTDQRDALHDRLIKRIPVEIPEVRFNIDFFKFGPPTGAPIQYRVMGQDVEKIREIIAQVRTVIDDHPDTSDTYLDWRGPIKTIQFEWNKGQLARYGLSEQSLANQINQLTSSFPVSFYREDNKQIAIVARLNPTERDGLADLQGLLISLPNGEKVALEQLTQFKVSVEDGVRWRYNRYPTIAVHSQIPYDIQPHQVIQQLQPQMDAIRANLPPGYFIEVAGLVESNKIVDTAMASTLPVVLVLIVTMLMIQLRSFPLTLLVLGTAPLGLIGAVLTLYAVGKPLGFVAQLGILAMAGIIMRNSVILMDQINKDIKHNASHPWQALIESTIRRFRPIVLTAIAAVLALAPLTTDLFWGPMAYAMMGGITGATILTIFFIPALYAFLFRLKPEAI